jgi:hypothetical protein
MQAALKERQNVSDAEGIDIRFKAISISATIFVATGLRYIAGGQLAVFQGGPSRTDGNEAPIFEPYGSIRRGGGKTANWAPAQRVAMKMGRRLRCSSVTSRTSLGAARLFMSLF